VEAGAAAVVGDFLIDGEGGGEGGAGLLRGDGGSFAGTDGVEEGLDLQAQGLAGSDGELLEAEGGAGRRGVGQIKFAAEGRILRVDVAGIDFDDESVLAGVVNRDILMGLEEAQFADAFGGDAAGGEVGDAAGFKLDANVGDVNFGGEDGESDGANFAERGAGHEEDDVEVVNHEVEDDVYVERARREDGEAMTLKKHGAGDVRQDGGDGRVEALEVADLEDAMARGGESEVKGFSTRTSMPASRSWATTAAWAMVGTQTEAAWRERVPARRAWSRWSTEEKKAALCCWAKARGLEAEAMVSAALVSAELVSTTAARRVWPERESSS
jgi:hypothetical protein